MVKNPILVLAGVGGGGGTGAATARVFAKAGYRVALLARNADSLNSLANSIKAEGGEAAPFAIESYTNQNLKPIFASIKQTWPDAEIRAAVWNAAFGIWKPFLDLTEDEIKTVMDTNVIGAFAFSREAILSFKELEPTGSGSGKRGTLIFTGATAAVRGNTTTSAFAASKHGVRGLSQSLAKEFGKERIHVAHAVIDGAIRTSVAEKYVSAEKLGNDAALLEPESIANAYLYLTKQDQTAFTWELDLRPADEKW